MNTSESKKQPVLIDMDPGIDDALALIYLNALQQWNLKAITVVAGNVSVDQGWDNARRLVRLLGLETAVPVYAGCSRPLLRSLSTETRVHGKTGLGAASLPEPRIPKRKQHAAQVINRLSHEYEGQLTLIAIGPLTNLAAALILDPKLADRIDHLYCMGGAIHVPGNTTAQAEFNIHTDPHAAQRVFESGLSYTLVGLDATNRTLLTEDHLAELKQQLKEQRTLSTPDSVLRFTVDALTYYLDRYQNERGMNGCALHDPLAVGAAFNPDFIRTVPGQVRVETRREHTLGNTVLEPVAEAENSQSEVAEAPGNLDFVEHFINTITTPRLIDAGLNRPPEIRETEDAAGSDAIGIQGETEFP